MLDILRSEDKELDRMLAEVLDQEQELTIILPIITLSIAFGIILIVIGVSLSALSGI